MSKTPVARSGQRWYAIRNSIIMQPLLAHLQRLPLAPPALKERLFHVIVDLSPRQFNQLCSEVLALFRFQRKYRDALVTDAPHLIRPFNHMLPRVELEVEIDGQNYDRHAFYRWLEKVSEITLKQIMMEMDALFDEAIEHIDCYVVDKKLCAGQKEDTCWKLELATSGQVDLLVKELSTWKTEPGPVVARLS